MNKAEYAKEVGMVAAIIADTIIKKFYDQSGIGYINVADQIARWAMEFVNKHENTNWEEVLDKGLEPVSKGFKKQSKELICWDDVAIDFAYHKLETYK